jgi:hypothetical protein
MTMKLKALLFVLASSAALLCGEGFAQAPAPVRIRGEIVAVDANSLTVHRQDGATVKVATKPDLAVSAMKNMSLADIKPGSFIGTTTKTAPSGEHVAVEVHVFPESARGTGEGDRPWDLGPGSAMTNGNVDTVVKSVDGRKLKVSYKGGTKEVTVPEGAPVVTPIPASRADLVVGKKVFLMASGDPSSLSAARVTVEKDGVVPPM